MREKTRRRLTGDEEAGEMEVIVFAVAASSPTLAWRALHLSLHYIVSLYSQRPRHRTLTGTSAHLTHSQVLLNVYAHGPSLSSGALPYVAPAARQYNAAQRLEL